MPFVRIPKRRKNTIVFMGRPLHLNAFCRKYRLQPAVVSKILNSKRPVDKLQVLTAERLAAAFNCTIEELLLHLRLRYELKHAETPAQPETFASL